MYKLLFFKLKDNGLFYDGNQGCYYYFDVIAQKYRLHSQIHSETDPLPPIKHDLHNQQNDQNVPGVLSEDSDSDNSEDSGNLVIKEDTEDSEQNDKDIKDVVVNIVESKPIECHEEKGDVKQESNLENSDGKDEKEEVKSENPPPPLSTCEVINIFFNLENKLFF